jgi:hypothetical protein
MGESVTCGWDVETADRTGWVLCGRPGKALTANGPVCGVHARSARGAGLEVTPLPCPDVRPGQVWADNDPRSAGRTLRVESITVGRAVCTVLTNSDSVQALLDSAAGYRGRDVRGNTVEIEVSRFRPTSTGYRLTIDATKGRST